VAPGHRQPHHCLMLAPGDSPARARSLGRRLRPSPSAIRPPLPTIAPRAVCAGAKGYSGADGRRRATRSSAVTRITRSACAGGARNAPSWARAVRLPCIRPSPAAAPRARPDSSKAAVERDRAVTRRSQHLRRLLRGEYFTRRCAPRRRPPNRRPPPRVPRRMDSSDYLDTAQRRRAVVAADDLLAKVDPRDDGLLSRGEGSLLSISLLRLLRAVPVDTERSRAQAQGDPQAVAERYPAGEIVHREKQGFMMPLERWPRAGAQGRSPAAARTEGLQRPASVRPRRSRAWQEETRRAQEPRDAPVGAAILERWLARYDPDSRSSASPGPTPSKCARWPSCTPENILRLGAGRRFPHSHRRARGHARRRPTASPYIAPREAPIPRGGAPAHSARAPGYSPQTLGLGSRSAAG